MDPISTLVAALAAGAAAGLQKAAGQAVKDAYAGVKDFLSGKVSSLTNLEEDPSDEDYRKAAGKELQKKGLATDPAVLEQIRHLTQAIEQEPPEQLAAWGIDIGQIRAAGSVLVENIEAEHGSVRVKDIDAQGGDARIKGIKAGGPAKNQPR